MSKNDWLLQHCPDAADKRQPEPELTWEQWAAEHPPDTLEQEPTNFVSVSNDDSLDSRINAEKQKDFEEQMQEYPYRVYLCNGKFYVVPME